MTDTMLLIQDVEGYFLDTNLSAQPPFRQSTARRSTSTNDTEMPDTTATIMNELHELSGTLKEVVEKQDLRQQEILEALRISRDG